MAYTIELNATNEYNAREITENAFKDLIETHGVLASTAEEAVEIAESLLPSGELNKYYTVEAVEFCVECGQLKKDCEC